MINVRFALTRFALAFEQRSYYQKNKLLMVDQLWLWILDNSKLIFHQDYQVQNTKYVNSCLDTLITSFSGKVNYRRSSVHKDIRCQL